MHIWLCTSFCQGPEGIQPLGRHGRITLFVLDSGPISGEQYYNGLHPHFPLGPPTDI